MEPLETINYRGYTIETNFDWDGGQMIADDLKEDDICFIVYDHRQFYVKKDGFEPYEIFQHLQQGYKTFKGYWVFPLYAYIHSGVALSLGRDEYPFTDRWDVSSTGFVLVSRKTWWKKEEAMEIAEGTVNLWNDLLSGQVFWFKIEPEFGIGDSCGGFVGQDGYNQMIEEAKGEIDATIQENVNKRIEQVKGYIKNRIPLIYRSPAIL